MRRVPIDSDFGPPIAVLRSSEVVLFENGTLAEYYREPFLKFNADEYASNLQDKPYLFFYNHITELADIKIGDDINKSLNREVRHHLESCIEFVENDFYNRVDFIPTTKWFANTCRQFLNSEKRIGYL